MRSRWTAPRFTMRGGSRGGLRLLVGLGGTLALAVAIAGCAAPGTADDEWQSGGGPPSAPVEQVAAIATATLGAEEARGLLWMREEEKLARDVYLALADLWNVRVFPNIARAEQAHMDALETLFDRYGLQDPTAGNPAGVFTDPAIQALYDELLARGRTSLVEALKVGATIEDLDIVDLRERASDTPDIARVYANLERGSENHLRAFVTNLERRGATYAPAYLAQADFDRIISAPRTRGATGTSEAHP